MELFPQFDKLKFAFNPAQTYRLAFGNYSFTPHGAFLGGFRATAINNWGCFALESPGLDLLSRDKSQYRER